MGAKERNKGKRGELELVHFLKGFGLNVRRGYVFQHESDLVGLDGIHVECKRTEKLNLKALDQAIEEAHKRKDGMPTVFWRASRKPWITIMLTEDWVRLYQLARWGHIPKRKEEE